MKSIAYIDGFNLYFGALKGTSHRWLDVSKMCSALLPSDQILRVRYFTARVNARPHDPHAPLKQETYLRALRTLPNVDITYGHFLSHPVWMPLAHPVPGGPPTVQVTKTEEKGSDVNLATALLVDAFNGAFEQAVVISGDSDLVAPIRAVIDETKRPVIVINPQKRTCQALLKVATSYRNSIRAGLLASCQFPASLSDANGTITKPATW